MLMFYLKNYFYLPIYEFVTAFEQSVSSVDYYTVYPAN